MIQKGLVVAEVALALLLMVGAGLMTRSFSAQLDVRPGFDHEALYAFRVTLPPNPYSGDALRAAMQEIEERLEAVSGVTAVTYASGAPLRGGYSASYLFVEGSSTEDRIRFYLQRVAPDWMETLGTRIVQGRALERADIDNPDVTVISQALAERFYPGQDPVGQTLRIGRPDGLQLAIVGVAEDVRYRDLTTDLLAGADDPDIYLPWERFATRTVDFVLRTETVPANLERTVREVVGGFDPDLPIFLAQPFSQSLRSQTAQARFGTVLLGTFSILAALLALVGLYGVLAFSVDQRRREIAVRMAIGAEAGSVRRMVVVQGMRLAAGGLVLGLVAALLASRSLEVFLYGVEPMDLGTYATVAGLMTVIGFFAAWLPALRATQVDPQVALTPELHLRSRTDAARPHRLEARRGEAGAEDRSRRGARDRRGGTCRLRASAARRYARTLGRGARLPRPGLAFGSRCSRRRPSTWTCRWATYSKAWFCTLSRGRPRSPKRPWSAA